jgi:HAD superfamily hydrolase (TIGR01490 family)
VAGTARLATALACCVPIARDRDASKVRVIERTLRGRVHAEIAELGERYGTQLAARVRPDMRSRLDWHRGEGHQIVIVSASLDVYLEPVRRELGLDALLCSRLEVDDGGRCTGAMVGGNCRGAAKAERLQDYLGPEPVALWAYGNSAGDDAMLALAAYPVRVGRVGRRSGRA